MTQCTPVEFPEGMPLLEVGIPLEVPLQYD